MQQKISYARFEAEARLWDNYRPDYAFSYGKLQIKCTKPGVAKIKIKAMAGSSSANGEMSGMEITKEFAIIARAVQAGNGGWL